MIVGYLYTFEITKLWLSVSEKRNELLSEGCHCKSSEKISILSRVKFSLCASRCKQVGVSGVQTRKSHCDWLSSRQQPVMTHDAA